MWVGGLAMPAVLLFGLCAGLGDSYPAPGFFADGITAQSTWVEIQKKSWARPRPTAPRLFQRRGSSPSTGYELAPVGIRTGVPGRTFNA
jgi:hypothetical protein